MKLFQELNQLDKDKQLDEAMDPMLQDFLVRFLHEVGKNPEVAEGIAVGALFLLGQVFRFYSDAYFGVKEFFAKFKRIKEMKNPEQQQKELKKLSDELDAMVSDVLKNKKVDASTRYHLKELQDEMRRKVDNMANFIQMYKETGKYPGGTGENIDKKINQYVSRWTEEFKKLRERVQKTVEKSQSKTTEKA